MKTIYFVGNGAAWSYYVGYMEYIKSHYWLPELNYAGVSSGSIIATLYGLKLEFKEMMDLYHLIFDSAFENCNSYAWIFYRAILPFLRTALHQTKYNISKINHIHIRVTNTYLQTWFINSFEDIEDLVQCIFSSIYIPYFVGGTFSHSHRGHNFIDGYYVDGLCKINDSEHHIVSSNTTTNETFAFKSKEDIKNLFIRGYLHAYQDREILDNFLDGEPIFPHDQNAENIYKYLHNPIDINKYLE